MAIQWYPGHMHKAQKQIKEVLPQVDLLIEVLDARIPFSSENPAIATLRGDKPCIKVLSKTDLADPEMTRQWQEYLEQQKNVKTLGITTEEPGKMKGLIDLCRKMLPEKDQGYSTIHTMIVGIPNVGKSTLINTLAGKTIAKTGNEPAVTKGQQRINLGNGIMLLDTPGILWPKVENDKSSYRLAASGAIKDTAMEYDDVAFFLADFLLQYYPELLKQRFELSELPATELEFLELAAARRGCLRPGGRTDLHKISEILINELRSGTLGRITLETPEMAIEEVRQVEAEKARKAEEDRARKEAFKQRQRGGHAEQGEQPLKKSGNRSKNRNRKRR
ncbi:MAG: ribosome biogenesis GTPase YlqF [Candidatus Pelagadaptatus aseana]|uniref:ribosome biogenesis GTPase YlqF n=1 Tax=Candidatus Pelagadaptatus aseana TaxID=3120508 RepID=UPI0039B1FE09